ncbi:MAG: hypothetical protein KTV77_00620 [Wolbachia endosymbiont of Fragariocoptes setiger]|nr:hypothetical protein [Wolbachia endosymbiont of Fragariocoptes setiger]
MSLSKWFFGFDQTDIERNANAVAEIEKYFPDILRRIKQLESQNIDLAEQINKLKEIYGNIDQKFAPLKENISSLMENVSENTNTLQEHTKSIAETSEKLTSLTEKVGNSDQMLIVCSIMASVAAITAFSFIAYCIYQSTQQEKEKKNESDNINLVNVDSYWWDDTNSTNTTFAKQGHNPRTNLSDSAYSLMASTQIH